MGCEIPDSSRYKDLLEKEISSRKQNSKLFLGGVFLNLIGFLFVPLVYGGDDKWLLLLIHFTIPLFDLAIVQMVFPLMRPYLIKGIKVKLKNPNINERDNQPLMIYYMFYIACFLLFGVGVSTMLTLVILKTKGSVLIVWGFLSIFTFQAAIEFKAAKAISLYVDKISKANHAT